MSIQPKQIAYCIPYHVCFEGEPVFPIFYENNWKIFIGRVCRVRCDNVFSLLFMLIIKFCCELLFYTEFLTLLIESG